ETPATRTTVILWGGGGEPENLVRQEVDPNTGRLKTITVGETIFDADLIAIRNAVRANPRWKVKEVLFAGGQSVTRQLAASIASDGVARRFDHAAVTGSVDQLVSSQLSDYREGDQILLILSSHGQRKSATEMTHKISTADGRVFALDRLQLLADLAARKNVRLAVIDDSCFSGSTVAGLKGKTLCAISTAGDEVGWSRSFGPALYTEMKAGVTLEQAYLRARLRTDRSAAPAQPQISTQAGRKARAAVSVVEKFMLAAYDVMPTFLANSPRPSIESPEVKKLFEDLERIDAKEAGDDLRRAMESYVNYRERAHRLYQELEALEKDARVDRARLSARKEGFRAVMDEMVSAGIFVALKERHVYKAFYQHFQSTSETEPCGSFVF
ncbi:MAG: hypothetical protein NDI61_14395, partial [Bdellovibrionaceae bacterium]|nr:hypothetical protein [Pseudobdellovibrionaceae bacterium]